MPGPAPILLYDGLCGFCDGAVQFILRHDRRGAVRFAPLQGPTAAAVIARHPELAGVDSLILVEGDQVRVRSDGALRVARLMGGAWPALAAVLRLVPRLVRDGVYDLIARNRFRLAGRRDACRLPAPGERGRFLE